MIQIRLKKMISGDQHTYYIVVTNRYNSASGGFIEKLGSYNPKADKWGNKYVFLNIDRYIYWLKKGALLNNRLYLLIFQSLF